MHVVYVVNSNSFDSSTTLMWSHLFIIIVLAMILAPVAGKVSEKINRKNPTTSFFLSWFAMIILVALGINWLIAHL